MQCGAGRGGKVWRGRVGWPRVGEERSQTWAASLKPQTPSLVQTHCISAPGSDPQCQRRPRGTLGAPRGTRPLAAPRARTSGDSRRLRVMARVEDGSRPSQEYTTGSWGAIYGGGRERACVTGHESQSAGEHLLPTPHCRRNAHRSMITVR